MNAVNRTIIREDEFFAKKFAPLPGRGRAPLVSLLRALAIGSIAGWRSVCRRFPGRESKQ